MSSTNTRHSIVDQASELFISSQYMKNTAIAHEFAMAALQETGRFLPEPWARTTDLHAFHDHMMMYLNL